MFRSSRLLIPRRNVLAAALGLPFLPAALAAADDRPPALVDAPAAQTPAGRVFASDAGMMLNTIKADKTADFEAVVAKLKAALQKANKPERTQQAASWRVFRALEPGANNSVLYVFWMDPPVKDADYTVSRILYEAYPDEAQALYKQFSDAYAGGQTLVNLKLVSRMGE
jgi:hypothetical protein